MTCKPGSLTTVTALSSTQFAAMAAMIIFAVVSTMKIVHLDTSATGKTAVLKTLDATIQMLIARDTIKSATFQTMRTASIAMAKIVQLDVEDWITISTALSFSLFAAPIIFVVAKKMKIVLPDTSAMGKMDALKTLGATMTIRCAKDSTKSVTFQTTRTASIVLGKIVQLVVEGWITMATAQSTTRCVAMVEENTFVDNNGNCPVNYPVC